MNSFPWPPGLRFKYPPHWVPLTTLWNAMLSVDAETGRARGYMVLKSNACLEASRMALTWRWPECSDLEHWSVAM